MHYTLWCHQPTTKATREIGLTTMIAANPAIKFEIKRDTPQVQLTSGNVLLTLGYDDI